MVAGCMMSTIQGPRCSLGCRTAQLIQVGHAQEHTRGSQPAGQKPCSTRHPPRSTHSTHTHTVLSNQMRSSPQSRAPRPPRHPARTAAKPQPLLNTKPCLHSAMSCSILSGMSHSSKADIVWVPRRRRPQPCPLPEVPEAAQPLTALKMIQRGSDNSQGLCHMPHVPRNHTFEGGSPVPPKRLPSGTHPIPVYGLGCAGKQSPTAQCLLLGY